MGTLSRLLSSKCRAEMLRLLFGLRDSELYVRELERLSGLKVATVRQELRTLSSLDLVVSRRSGNRLYYRANRSHPLYPELHGLVLKTVGLIEILRARLAGAPIQVAFVFGSIAKESEDARSDVDLFVVGEVGLRDVSPLLAGVSDEIFREVNPYVLTVKEFVRRRQAKEHFVTSVLRERKLFVAGDEEVLRTLGE